MLPVRGMGVIDQGDEGLWKTRGDLVGLASLWIPIVLSAAFVFLASSMIHLALRYHWSDWAKLPGDPEIPAAFRKQSVRPGGYSFPRPASPAEMNTAGMREKLDQGPVGFVTIVPSGPPAMGRSLALWFLYSVGVSFLAAYLAGRTLGAATRCLQVFRVVGTVAFLTQFRRGTARFDLDGAHVELDDQAHHRWVHPRHAHRRGLRPAVAEVGQARP